MELLITQVFQSPVASSLLFPNFSPATSFQTPVSATHPRLMVRDQVSNVQNKSKIKYEKTKKVDSVHFVDRRL
jgi:hypothetical protein